MQLLTKDEIVNKAILVKDKVLKRTEKWLAPKRWVKPSGKFTGGFSARVNADHIYAAVFTAALDIVFTSSSERLSKADIVNRLNTSLTRFAERLWSFLSETTRWFDATPSQLPRDASFKADLGYVVTTLLECALDFVFPKGDIAPDLHPPPLKMDITAGP